MRRSLQSMVVVVAFTALLGCGTTPVAPTQASSEEFDPTALFARLAGCGPQKLPQGSKFRSRGHRLKTILVVQAAEDRGGDDTVEGEDPTAAGRSCETIV